MIFHLARGYVMSILLGVISGTIIVERSNLLNDCETKKMQNQYGEAVLHINKRLAFIQRHGNEAGSHILPHLINHRANIQALKDCGVTEIVGISSAGSLKNDLKPGTIVIPDDFLTLTATPTIHQDKAVHIVPLLSAQVRARLIASAHQCGINIRDTGTYLQTTGPRLETKAEIRMMANFADIVGMTMANEAVISQELNLPYASICSVDNYGNGLTEIPLSLDEILTGASRNADLLVKILQNYLGL